MGPLTGKVALVTGGSGGIGAAIARRLSADGASVAVGYRLGAAQAGVVANDLPGPALAVAIDVADGPSVRAAMAQVIAEWGRLDIVVNTAGIAPYLPLEDIDDTHMRIIFETNVQGVVHVTKAAAEVITAPGGRIVHFSSRLADFPRPGTSIYAASKGAVDTLVNTFGKELAPRGIIVNAVAPGVIDTPMTREVVRELGAAIAAATPVGRIGQPEDIAGIVAFLSGPDCGWIVGRSLLADGGLS